MYPGNTNDVFTQFNKIPLLNRDVDFFSIFLGTNDYGYGNRLLGSPDDQPTDESGANTIYGAMHYILHKITSVNPDAKIMLLALLWRSGGYEKKNAVDVSLMDVREAVYTVGERFSCKIVDLKDVVTEENKKDLLQTDVLHASPEGYEAIYQHIKQS
jgi:lysophospholipase L1-like esterase